MTDTAIKILQYLEANSLLKKTLIEGLSDHIPSISRIINESNTEESGKMKQAFKSWIAWWFNSIHSTYHRTESRFYKDCQDPVCKSATRTCEELI